MTCHHIPSITCPECRPPQDGPSYPDDVVAVMRDTITAQREEIARHAKANEELRLASEGLWHAYLNGVDLLERCWKGFDWNQFDDREQNEIGQALRSALIVAGR